MTISWRRIFNCSRGIHRHSRGQAQHDGFKWVSVCKDCGTHMMRDMQGRWSVVMASPAASDPQV